MNSCISVCRAWVPVNVLKKYICEVLTKFMNVKKQFDLSQHIPDHKNKVLLHPSTLRFVANKLNCRDILIICFHECQNVSKDVPLWKFTVPSFQTEWVIARRNAGAPEVHSHDPHLCKNQTKFSIFQVIPSSQHTWETAPALHFGMTHGGSKPRALDRCVQAD